jgi:hypothetical protein
LRIAADSIRDCAIGCRQGKLEPFLDGARVRNERLEECGANGAARQRATGMPAHSVSKDGDQRDAPII